MKSRMRELYDQLQGHPAAKQISICKDFVGKPAILFEHFCDSFEQVKTEFCNAEQRFQSVKSLERRAAATGVIGMLMGSSVAVTGGPQDYCFVVVGREVPPLRVEGTGERTGGARGGIDYVARKALQPILGEIKDGSDQNPFYAFVQLLTYLSEMATPNQIGRANKHTEFQFDSELKYPQQFDLHILLADFNDHGGKGPLVNLARELAEAFKKHAAGRSDEAASVLGTILCLQMEKESFKHDRSLRCLWSV